MGLLGVLPSEIEFRYHSVMEKPVQSCKWCGVTRENNDRQICVRAPGSWMGHSWVWPDGVDDRTLNPGQHWANAQVQDAVWTLLEEGETVFEPDDQNQCRHCGRTKFWHTGKMIYRCVGRHACPDCGSKDHKNRECYRAPAATQPAPDQVTALQAEVTRWRNLAMKRRLRLRGLQAAVHCVLREKGIGVKGELEAALAYSEAKGVGAIPHEQRHEAMEAAIKVWIKKHEGHGPSANDAPDIHWPLYEADFHMFQDALKGIKPKS